MSTPDPHDVDDHATSAPEADEIPPRRGNSAGVLWTVVLVALIALGFWWYSQRPATVSPQALPQVETPATTGQEQTLTSAAEPEETLPTAAEKGSPAIAARPGEPPARPATRPVAKPARRPAPLSRDPVPLQSNQTPRYPARALRSGIEGSVSVLVEVGADGVPTDVRVVRRSGERSRDLDRAVTSAALDWRFEPALRDGKAVAGAVVLPVDFKRE
ncbi:MAG TPA: TonB family protein [Pseudoxanthomonas sp.]|nr:TonB family protein [Pseudoxanthomonas sp.]